jgi:hypothetical protein
MMRLSNDVGNAGLYSGGVAGTVTTAGTITNWLTTNATLIGLGLTAFSIVVGIVFKIISARQEANHLRIMREQDMAYKRWQMSRDDVE